jgi:hypothetical protein
MISGPISRRVLCELLGKTDAALETLIKDDALPVLQMPGETRSKAKVYFSPLLAWMNSKTTGQAWTEAQLEAELRRAIDRLRVLDEAKRKRKAARAAA